MDTEVPCANVLSTNPQKPQRCCCVPSDDNTHTGCINTNNSDYVFDMNDHTTLISNCLLKNKKHHCQCSPLRLKNKSKSQNSKPWVTFMQIFCSAVLALFAIYLSSNILIFEKMSKEMDDITWRSQFDVMTTTQLPTSSTTELPLSKDKCEPLYVLIYAHCFVWFLFLVLDHVSRHMLHTTLRSRGHLQAFSRLGRLAAIPFQLVSLWTVLLAIFIAVYAQQDKADMQPYCDANMLISPKNGIAVLLVIEFICVTIASLVYGNAIRKFSLEKPPPDVYGWEESNYFDRRISHRFLNGDTAVNQPTDSEDNSNYEQHETKCLLDMLEYYTQANQELSATLGRTAQKLRQLELENKSQQQQSQS